ncbi:S-layer homology domain-containing protein [Bacillus songklensis]|uniref:S-layer homology domain-containing protein n=1 Tax=Bacillus songklensis TaxID=1069116 RepID=A0ABV8B5G0_9BACI
MKKKLVQLTTAFLLIWGLMAPTSTSAASNFSDVPSNFWAYKEIQYLVGKEVIRGYPNGTFGPNNSIKRIQAASMLVKALGLSTTNHPNPGFKDLKPGDYGYEIAAAVADEGILTGSNGYFNPNGTLTRAQMAKILSEAYGLGYVFETTFRDVTKSHWAFRYVNALYGNGITTGYADFTFRPNENVSRAQFSVFMARALNPDFKPGIIFKADQAKAEWKNETTLVIEIPMRNNYPYTVTNIKSQFVLAVGETMIAEKSFNFGSGITLKSGETKTVTLEFTTKNMNEVEEGLLYLYWQSNGVRK